MYIVETEVGFGQPRITVYTSTPSLEKLSVSEVASFPTQHPVKLKGVANLQRCITVWVPEGGRIEILAIIVRVCGLVNALMIFREGRCRKLPGSCYSGCP